MQLTLPIVARPMMFHRYPLFCAVAMVLAGCAAGAESATDAGAPLGYRYHDGNHPNGVNQASPQAIYNATHGTWLWPPQTADWP
jgi:hypothetical protein